VPNGLNGIGGGHNGLDIMKDSKPNLLTDSLTFEAGQHLLSHSAPFGQSHGSHGWAGGQDAEKALLNGLTGSVIQGLSLGLILIIVGFLFKIAAAPFHNWSPDVYDDSPTNVTIWLTIMPKIAIVIFLLELEMGIVSITATTGGLNYAAPDILQDTLNS
jgi:Proton-conducting membrane transporter